MEGAPSEEMRITSRVNCASSIGQVVVPCTLFDSVVMPPMQDWGVLSDTSEFLQRIKSGQGTPIASTWQVGKFTSCDPQ